MPSGEPLALLTSSPEYARPSHTKHRRVVVSSSREQGSGFLTQPSPFASFDFEAGVCGTRSFDRSQRFCRGPIHAARFRSGLLFSDARCRAYGAVRGRACHQLGREQHRRSGDIGIVKRRQESTAHPSPGGCTDM